MMTMSTSTTTATAHDDADVALPSQYASAEALAHSMLVAAMHGDWPKVSLLQRRIPQLASELNGEWQALRARHPSAPARLERDRIDAIRRVLLVDARIRRLADPRMAVVERVLTGTCAH